MKRTRLALALVLAIGSAAACRSRETRLAAPPASSAPSPTPLSTANFDKLVGRWMREDGGYVLEIRSVSPEGKVDAAYFNPRPIHVARAEAFREGDALTLFVELRDVNYPGSTYRLQYDPAADMFSGAYVQALQGQTFDVTFVRR